MKKHVNKNGRYTPHAIEEKWRAYWQKIDLYKTGDDPEKPNYYILDYFPYPSGAGLSVGHGRNYVPTCVNARFMRMRGYNVLHPMGWDAFGLPAENYAIQHDIQPEESSAQFAATYRRQMQLMECSYDWSREFSSTDPDYYRWTQWFFLLLHKRGLAYRALGNQWWCPSCQTILANEQVEQGRCWRCDSLVAQKALQQWYFKITEYADRLLADLDTIDWPQSIKTMQRNWIGRSDGADVIFTVAGSQQEEISVFTTRPDTLFGVTYLALAPEHPLVQTITTATQQTAVSAYVDHAKRMTEIERAATDKAKTGVFTGAYATHPLSGAPIPIWVADYVLMAYGSGAIMGVPAHDDRDMAFAQTHDLPVVPVIADGKLVQSGTFNGLSVPDGARQITAALVAAGKGQAQVRYKLRDWLISRQRYWGAPIPIIHCPDCGVVPVPERELPVRLPTMSDFAPSGDGRSPLARATDWVNTTCPRCGAPAQRETDTMDGFACSSWYFLRFASPHYDAGPFDPDAMEKWLPVDAYVGGAEHAVMHLLYARFWTKVMYDAGLVSFTEPFHKLQNQGMLLSAEDGRKMSKSRNNVVTPDEMIARHGTDALRIYLLFLGPFDADVTWDESGIRGVTRFLDRYYRLAVSSMATATAGNMEWDEALTRAQHRLVQRMTREMADFRFNTAVAALMGFLNDLVAAEQTGNVPAAQGREALTTLTLLLAPMAPFITEEVWQNVLGESGSVHQQSWPTFDEAKTAVREQKIIIQVDGKLRDHLLVPVDVDTQALQEQVVQRTAVLRHTRGKTIRKIVVVPDKLINIVTA